MCELVYNFCGGQLLISEYTDARRGFVCKFLISCKNFINKNSNWAYKECETGLCEDNMRLFYMRCTGEGLACADLNLLKPVIGTSTVIKVGTCVESVVTESMYENSTLEVSVVNESDKNISLGSDGSWQKERTSLHSCTTAAASINTGNVLNAKVMNNFVMDVWLKNYPKKKETYEMLPYKW